MTVSKETFEQVAGRFLWEVRRGEDSTPDLDHEDLIDVYLVRRRNGWTLAYIPEALVFGEREFGVKTVLLREIVNRIQQRFSMRNLRVSTEEVEEMWNEYARVLWFDSARRRAVGARRGSR
jgi:hypothetical protein